MRIIVFFDLPVETSRDRKEYRVFRKFLIEEGFVMMQKSVYCKLALNRSIMNGQIKRLRTHRPKAGIVEILTVTEKQFTQIEYLIGEKQTTTIDNEDRLIIL